MSDKKEPSKSEIKSLADFLRGKFVISDEEALSEATHFLNLTYEWGSPPPDVNDIMLRRMNGKYEWLNKDEKEAFDEGIRDKFKVFEGILKEEKE